MKLQNVLLGITAGIGLSLSSAYASVVVGTYSFESEQLVDQVLSFTGTGLYTGSGYVNPLTDSTNITDTDPVTSPITFLATAPYAGYQNETMGLGFSQTSIFNGDGADIALFFLFNQSTNAVDVTLNNITNRLSFADVYSSSGVQQVADGVEWNGATLNNVLVQVAEIDLSDFGFANRALLNEALLVNMNQTGAGNEAVALSLVGGLNTALVPVPAAVWLFGSGLLGLVGVARTRHS